LLLGAFRIGAWHNSLWRKPPSYVLRLMLADVRSALNWCPAPLSFGAARALSMVYHHGKTLSSGLGGALVSTGTFAVAVFDFGVLTSSLARNHSARLCGPLWASSTISTRDRPCN
jgi:hypothetical protein